MGIVQIKYREYEIFNTNSELFGNSVKDFPLYTQYF